jgi:hemerythrin-like metal-binding protein
MTKLLWDESLETGIIEIDIQHRNLFNIFKVLDDSIDQGKSSMIIKYIIDEIVRYGDYHMKAEESILKKYNVFTETHEAEHLHFKNQVQKFKEKYINTKDKVLAKEISEYLYTWVTNHIMKTDMEELDHLKEEFKRLGKGE